MAGHRRPWFKFFPNDWLGDPHLSTCSLAAQGAWIRLLCLSKNCDEPGRFITGGVVWDDARIGRVIGDGGAGLLLELLSNGVASRDERGIYCRRMVRDEYLRQIRSIAGKQGGSPILLKQSAKQSVSVCVSESLESDSLEEGMQGEKAKRAAAERLPFLTTDLDEIYSAYPRHVGRKRAFEKIGRALIDIHARANGSLEDPAAWLLERVKTYAASPAGKAGQYTPHPATWFNQGRYDDDESEWQRNGTDGRGAGRVVANKAEATATARRQQAEREFASPIEIPRF